MTRSAGCWTPTSTPGSELRLRIAATMQRLGARLVTDPDLQERVDESIQRGVVLRRRQLPQRGQRAHRIDDRQVGRAVDGTADGAPGRARPAVHPHQRHDRRVHRRRADPRVHAGAVAGTGTVAKPASGATRPEAMILDVWVGFRAESERNPTQMQPAPSRAFARGPHRMPACSLAPSDGLSAAQSTGLASRNLQNRSCDQSCGYMSWSSLW